MGYRPDKFKFRYIIQIGTDSNISFYAMSPAVYDNGDRAEVAAFDFLVWKGYNQNKISKKWIHVRKERTASTGNGQNKQLHEHDIHHTCVPKHKLTLNSPRTRDGLAMFDSYFNQKRLEWVRIWDEQVLRFANM